MISRVADSCFWLFRYIERAESCARLASVNRMLVLDAEHDRSERWKPVIVVLGEQARFEELVGKDRYHDDDDAEDYLTWNQENSVSMRSSLYWARENARMIREVISREMWETLNTSWQWFTSKAAQREYRKDRSQFYRRIRSLCAEFLGTSDSTMLHEEPLDFMLLGMALERANQTARLMDVKHHRASGGERESVETPWQSAQWVSQLKLCAAEEPFLKRHRAAPTGRRVVDFLLRDASFPRSALHCFDRAERLLRRIEAATLRSAPTTSLTALQAILKHLREAKITDVLHSGLHEELTRVVDTVALVCDHLQRDFLDPTAEPEPPAAQAAQSQSQLQT
ncbi:MAG: alpha-E domain-containing protein [Deltaproteobacteria bacterium]